ncbi:MAG: hypothetical protein IKQ35_02150 [Bacilli bacterium]|nr:hypothetical protein [Bacilli bacterium]
MKKVLGLFILLLAIIPVKSLALSYDEVEKYKVDENVNIGFSHEWYVFTRDNYIGNSELSSLGITEDKMKEIFDNNNIYVDALNKKDFNKEFFVRKISYPEKKNMKDYTEKELKAFGDSFVLQLPTDEWKKYENDNNTYLLINFVDTIGGKTVYMEEYITSYNGYVYSFGLQTTGKVLTESDKSFVKSTVDMLEYSADTTKKDDSKKDDTKKDDTKKDTDEEKEDKEDSDKKDMLVFGVLAIGIVCVTAIIITLIVQSNKNKQK